MKTANLMTRLSLTVFFVFYLFFSNHSILNAKPRKVWVKPHKTVHGVVVPGHYRAASRNGFVWVAGKKGPNGHFVAGYWKPAKSIKGKVWVPGYTNAKGVWVDGYWRPEKKHGYVWVAGHRNVKGNWVKGHWKRV